ncbi:MAG: MerR family transcriptional regulator [Desulfobaccales bacterium]
MKIFEAKTELEKHRGRTDIRLDELVDIANHLIRLVVPEQPSDRVAETLNERTLRFYITEGLIDRPLGKEGTAALYGYRHLLQALIVKALQGAYLPIKRIKEILAGKNDRELEAILACQTLETPGGDPGLEPFEAMLREFQELDVHLARQKALNYLENLVSPLEPPSRLDMLFCSPPVPRQEVEPLRLRHAPGIFRHRGRYKQESPVTDTWERLYLDDGIELHIRSDRLKELRSSEIKRILERLRNLLKTKKQQ